jgi:pyruvate/2-oxoglutarate/acetoin dehydrogenase E1 component
MNYFEELKKAMTYLGKNPDTIFIGQAVEYAGTGMTNSLADVPADKKLELPVCEDFQAGLANGLALAGKIPISIYPRWNFLLLAMNQICNHLDKIPDMSTYRPKVIIRTAIGAKFPVHPQHQHIGDYTDAFKIILKNIEVIRLDMPEQIAPAYEKAINRTDGKSTILVEWGDMSNPEGTTFKIQDYYNEK